MGQAKNRGNLNNRINQAKEKIAKLRPELIICNDCGNNIYEITDLDVRNLTGIDAAFAGVCLDCKGTSYAIKGTPEGMTNFTLALQSITNSDVITGTQTKEGSR